MKKIFLVLACVLVGGCSASDGGGRSRGEGDFCPGCRTFCGADCPKTEQGACKACGRAPVQVSACELTWYWCGVHATWHAGKACAEHDSKSCCEPSKPSLALCLPADAKGVEKAKYCPACRCFCGGECPMDDQGNCRKCGKPPVTADALAGIWHWCTEHKRWHEGKPCGEQAARKCCSEAKSRVLVCRP